MTPDAIVVDTSVFIAALFEEADTRRLLSALRGARTRLLSAGNYLECAIVSSRRADGPRDLDAWLERERLAVVAVDLRIASIAADAFGRFGRGRHPAGLNYGDCFA